MVNFPMRLLVFALAMSSFQFLIAGDDIFSGAEFSLDVPEDPTPADILPIALDFLKLPLELMTFLFKVATFGFVEDMPVWLRVPLSIPTLAGFVWPGVLLFIRALEGLGGLIPFT